MLNAADKLKQSVEREVSSASPKTKEAFKKIIDDLNQATSRLKDAAESAISSAFVDAQEKLICAAQTFKEKAQVGLQEIQPNAKEALKQGIAEINQAVQEFKNAITGTKAG